MNMRFVQGIILGVLFTLLVLWLSLRPLSGDLVIGQLPTQLPIWDQFWTWVYANLGWSIPVFALILVLFCSTIAMLQRELANPQSIERIAQLDHLLDTWISLFFGVGVIWTAIGMRSALVFALGEPEVTLNLGAYAILERMVQGGILLALSTTIVGGIGGYLLRVIKTLTVETGVKRFYDLAAHAPGLEVQATLNAIEGHLRQLASPPA